MTAVTAIDHDSFYSKLSRGFLVAYGNINVVVVPALETIIQKDLGTGKGLILIKRCNGGPVNLVNVEFPAAQIAYQ
jgi:hypothetical protein